ncbi:MAG: orotate phosphoribosyltransferase [Pseudomonadota bacterium]
MTQASHIYKPSQNRVDIRLRLAKLILDKSFFFGETITLASGQTSDFYFNTKPTMLHPEGASSIATLMLDALSDVTFELIGGLEMGAVPIASAIAAVSHIQNRPVRAFFVRKQAKQHGTKSLIEGLEKNETVSGKNVVVVEDVTTTGGSAVKAAKILQDEGANVCHVITVIDREEGAADLFYSENIPFTALFGASEFRKMREA